VFEDEEEEEEEEEEEREGAPWLGQAAAWVVLMEGWERCAMRVTVE